jgi:hypothetical protein
MTEIRETLLSILQEAGFRTWLVPTRTDSVCFEDEALMGFACVFDNVATLLAHWRTVETALLTQYAPRLREAGDKAWNFYSIFLCSLHANENELREVHWIAEDLERTRKIAACDLVGREDLVIALLPVLPLQHQPSLSSEDLTERLRKRIAIIAPAATEAALDNRFNPAEVVPLLTESK